MQFDQRYVRREPSGYKMIGGFDLCTACGSNELCALARAVEHPLPRCGEFLPVVGFKSSLGLDTLFNTFRRGAGLFNRVHPGARVRLRVDDANGERFVGYGKVVEKHVGDLGPLLDDHAAMNHLYKGHPERMQAPSLLLKTLIKMYGRNYAGPAARFSAVYIEPEEIYDDPLSFALPD